MYELLEVQEEDRKVRDGITERRGETQSVQSPDLEFLFLRRKEGVVGDGMEATSRRW